MAEVSETKRRILDTARTLFNEHGLHRVGVRDIARAVGMSPGNLAYHYATKDDLVSALVLELHELNARTVFAEIDADFSLVTLYRSAAVAMRHMLVFRFVLLSYVDAVMVSPELQELEKALWRKRRRRTDAMLERLAHNGYLDRRAIATRAEWLQDQGDIVSSGWLVAATVRPRWHDDEQVVLHYAKVGCALLEPCCTPRGVRQLKQILAGAHDDATW
jgi:AcrR family transcriptional regulator